MNLDEKFAYMATGQPYRDTDAELTALRDQATLTTNAVNATADPETKETLLRQLVGSAGRKPFVNPNFRVEFGRNIHLGDNFYANYDCVMLDGAPITIGSQVLLGPKSAFTRVTTCLMQPNELGAAASPDQSQLVMVVG